MDGNYYLGLDMGTSSCGWSVTDEEYHVLRRHGKALWGVRLFEGAKTAEERRMHRTGRRRLDRRGWRINILQELFAEEVSKIDPGFFLRMKESKYYPEDKRDINGERPELPYALFVDPEFTDKDYHREFPTIYHLRKWLMETKEVPDGRYVLSDADKELGISKNMDIVFDIFSIDINSKKIVNKLYEEMQQVVYSEKLYVKTQEIAQSIQKYILELEQETDYILTFTEDVDWMAIFKALRVQHEIIEEDYFEKLIRYIKVATVVMKYKIFVFVNLRSYLSDLQMQKLIQEAIHQEVKLIFVENYVKDCMGEGLRYIIDRDQCEIY